MIEADCSASFAPIVHAIGAVRTCGVSCWGSARRAVGADAIGAIHDGEGVSAVAANTETAVLAGRARVLDFAGVAACGVAQGGGRRGGGCVLGREELRVNVAVVDLGAQRDGKSHEDEANGGPHRQGVSADAKMQEATLLLPRWG